MIDVVYTVLVLYTIHQIVKIHSIEVVVRDLGALKIKIKLVRAPTWRNMYTVLGASNLQMFDD